MVLSCGKNPVKKSANTTARYIQGILSQFSRVQNPKGPFLKFKVEINYGDSARQRPENEKGFQVLKEFKHYRREMDRRKSEKSKSKEAIASDSAQKTT